jgi:hypothetical protein
VRPCGFPPVPAATICAPQSSRFGHRLGRVMHRRSFTAGVPLPARAVTRPGRRTPHRAAPVALLGFRPSRRCSRARVSRRFRRSDPPAVSPATHSRRVDAFDVPSGRPMAFTHWLWCKADSSARHRPRLLGFVPACGPFPCRQRIVLPSGPGPPWTFPLSGLRSSPSCPGPRRARPVDPGLSSRPPMRAGRTCTRSSGVVRRALGALSAREPCARPSGGLSTDCRRACPSATLGLTPGLPGVRRRVRRPV